MQTKLLITGLCFIFIFLFGFWLSRVGKPYNSLIFNFHKLIGLAMGAFLILTIYRAHKTISLNPTEILVIGITVMIFIILVAAGGLLSIEAAVDPAITDQPVQTVVSVIHKVFPYLAVLATAGTLYMLLFNKT
jgi:hypothetical protein